MGSGLADRPAPLKPPTPLPADAILLIRSIFLFIADVASLS